MITKIYHHHILELGTMVCSIVMKCSICLVMSFSFPSSPCTVQILLDIPFFQRVHIMPNLLL